MAKKAPGKINLARKLWKQMPSASIDDFMKAYEQQYGDTISQPAVYAAKRDVGSESQVGTASVSALLKNS